MKKILLVILILLVSASIFLLLRIEPVRNKVVKLSPKIEQKYIVKTPDLEQIFKSDHGISSTLPRDRIRVLMATGDVIPARMVNYQAVRLNNFKWPFEKTAGVLRSADVTFVNLESPLIKNCPVSSEGMIFCGDTRNIEGLTYAGIDVANLANNHLGNYGIVGINSTIELLSKAGIVVTGRSGAVFKNIRGLEFAFLGYNEIGSKEKGISWVEEDKISREIKEARSKANVVIVTFHWGTEYVSQPTERQRKLAHLAIDNGADLIIGNHPHWIQPVELYKGKLITYAHGNFVFDQMWSEKTREGVVGRYTFFDNKLIDVEFLPVKIEDYGQPYFLERDKKNQILKEMKEESLKI